MQQPSGSPSASRLPDGLSAEQLRRSLEGIPSTLQGMRSPLGEPVRSECVAGMDMLNDMFQRQARRLESQLYQRAQDMRTIEIAQRQAAVAREQVRQLEQNHLEQAARISQGAKSLQRLQELVRESIASNSSALDLCEALEQDAADLKRTLGEHAGEELSKLQLRRGEFPSTEALKQRASSLENALAETERSAMLQIGATPLTSVAMSSDCNPLNDLSAVADYAAKASVGAGGSEAPSQHSQTPGDSQTPQQPSPKYQSDPMVTTDITQTDRAVVPSGYSAGASAHPGHASAVSRGSVSVDSAASRGTLPTLPGVSMGSRSMSIDGSVAALQMGSPALSGLSAPSPPGGMSAALPQSFAAGGVRAAGSSALGDSPLNLLAGAVSGGLTGGGSASGIVERPYHMGSSLGLGERQYGGVSVGSTEARFGLGNGLPSYGGLPTGRGPSNLGMSSLTPSGLGLASMQQQHQLQPQQHQFQPHQHPHQQLRDRPGAVQLPGGAPAASQQLQQQQQVQQQHQAAAAAMAGLSQLASQQRPYEIPRVAGSQYGSSSGSGGGGLNLS